MYTADLVLNEVQDSCETCRNCYRVRQQSAPGDLQAVAKRDHMNIVSETKMQSAIMAADIGRRLDLQLLYRDKLKLFRMVANKAGDARLLMFPKMPINTSQAILG